LSGEARRAETEDRNPPRRLAQFHSRDPARLKSSQQPMTRTRRAFGIEGARRAWPRPERSATVKWKRNQEDTQPQRVVATSRTCHWNHDASWKSTGSNPQVIATAATGILVNDWRA
jgi:hypothetical protein